MKKIIPLISSLFLLTFVSCTTVAPSQYYRPANHPGQPYKISGKMNPMKGLAGNVEISINDEVVIDKNLPFFTNSTEVSGNYKGKRVTAILTRIHTFFSSYTRGEVLIENERAASLTF